MKIDQYLKFNYTKKSRTTTLDEIFQRIKSSNQTIEKKERIGNVFATRTKQGRKHSDIKEFTGLLFIDIDNCSDYLAVKNLFIRIEQCIAVWYSSSGVNVHALIKIPICTSVEEYKRRYKAFIQLLAPYLTDIATIDTITSNPAQLAFESYDPDIFINPNPSEFVQIMPKPIPKLLHPINFDNSPTSKTEKWVIDTLTLKFNNIISNGYTQVRNYSLWLGGNISGGYINENIAKEVIRQLIESNNYLNSDSSSGTIKTYHKVAKWGINEGMLDPIIW